MKLGQTNSSIAEADMGDTFHLSPIALAIYPVQTIKVSDTRSPCNRFNLRDFVNNLEIHPSYPSDLFSLTLATFKTGCIQRLQIWFFGYKSIIIIIQTWSIWQHDSQKVKSPSSSETKTRSCFADKAIAAYKNKADFSWLRHNCESQKKKGIESPL